MELDDHPPRRVGHQCLGELAGQIRLARTRRTVEHDLALVFEQGNDVVEELSLDEELVAECVQRIEVGLHLRFGLAFRVPVEERADPLRVAGKEPVEPLSQEVVGAHLQLTPRLGIGFGDAEKAQRPSFAERAAVRVDGDEALGVGDCQELHHDGLTESFDSELLVREQPVNADRRLVFAPAEVLDRSEDPLHLDLVGVANRRVEH
jgi:hypothetical protein